MYSKSFYHGSSSKYHAEWGTNFTLSIVERDSLNSFPEIFLLELKDLKCFYLLSILYSS